jgi:hypothetical protein
MSILVFLSVSVSVSMSRSASMFTSTSMSLFTSAVHVHVHIFVHSIPMSHGHHQHFSLPPESGPSRPLGLTLSETALASAHRRLLGQQVPQLPQLRIFWPCTIAAARVVLRPESTLAARQEYKRLSLRIKSQHPPPQPQDAAAAIALVDAVRPSVLQCPPAPLTRQSFWLRH